VVRELSELEIGFAVAVHEHYLRLSEYREATPGVLSARIDVPKLTAAEQVSEIIDHRVRAFVGEGRASEILDPEAMSRLWEFYSSDANRSLRVTLQIAHTAVTEAALGAHDRVGAGLIETAIAAWLPPAPN
jgi:hypothetical protein